MCGPWKPRLPELRSAFGGQNVYDAAMSLRSRSLRVLLVGASIGSAGCGDDEGTRVANADPWGGAGGASGAAGGGNDGPDVSTGGSAGSGGTTGASGAAGTGGNAGVNGGAGAGGGAGTSGTTIDTQCGGKMVVRDTYGCTTEWTMSHCLGGQGIGGMATDGSTYVAVGECYTNNEELDCGSPTRYGGLVMTSATGLSDWTVQQSKASYSLADVVYAKGLFIAIGNKKTIISSPDGVAWTSRMSGAGTGAALKAIEWSGTQFVVVGTTSAVFTSSNGLTWQDHSFGGSALLTDVAYDASLGLYAASAYGGVVYTSPDAETWTRRTVAGAGNLHTITQHDGTFIAGGRDGQSYFSTDGTSWEPTESTVANWWLGSTYWDSCSRFVVATNYGGGPHPAILESIDAVSYTTALATGTKHNVTGVLADGNRAIVYGPYAAIHYRHCTCP